VSAACVCVIQVVNQRGASRRGAEEELLHSRWSTDDKDPVSPLVDPGHKCEEQKIALSHDRLVVITAAHFTSSSACSVCN
jgi:hypothetical protein